MVRGDLKPGEMLAQSCHVVSMFGYEHPEITKEWITNSNYIAVLQCKDETELLKLVERADTKGVKFSVFFEPDMDNQMTAVALEPGIVSKKLCSNFRLALKDK